MCHHNQELHSTVLLNRIVLWHMRFEGLLLCLLVAGYIITDVGRCDEVIIDAVKIVIIVQVVPELTALCVYGGGGG
jgi:hypothetical protein